MSIDIKTILDKANTTAQIVAKVLKESKNVLE